MITFSQLFAREIVNGLLALTVLCVVAMCLFRLVYDWWTNKPKFRDFFWHPDVRTCIALIVLFSAEAVQRFWVFMLLRRSIRGQSIAWMDAHYFIPLIASCFVSVGAFCLIRVLAPRGTGIRSVTLSLLICALFLIILL